MAFNVISGDVAPAFRKTIYGPTWNDFKAVQVNRIVVTAYGDVPFVFSIGTKVINGNDDNQYQYRTLASRITLNPGESYELDAIITQYNQVPYVRQISGNGIAYIYATPATPPANKAFTPIGSSSQTNAGQNAFFYMNPAWGDYGLVDVVIGNTGGTPTVNVTAGSDTTTPGTINFVRRGVAVPQNSPLIIRKLSLKAAKYITVQVAGGSCDIDIRGFGFLISAMDN